MFVTRMISGIVLVIIAFLTIWAGDLVLLATMYLVSLAGFRELTKALKLHAPKGFSAFEWIGFAGITAYYACLWFWGLGTQAMLAIVMTLMAMMAAYVLRFPKFRCEQPVSGFFAFFYAPVLLSFLYLTRTLENGFYLVWLIFISSWISDTCAYLVGRAIGKHKLAPVLSPKKSIEGSVGGILGSALVGALYGFCLAKAGVMDITAQAGIFALIGAAGSVLSQIGDLAASGIKRDHDIKDYGKLIPGHGGIMDRFDSVIATAPVIYFLALYFVQ